MMARLRLPLARLARRALDAFARRGLRRLLRGGDAPARRPGRPPEARRARRDAHRRGGARGDGARVPRVARARRRGRAPARHQPLRRPDRDPAHRRARDALRRARHPALLEDGHHGGCSPPLPGRDEQRSLGRDVPSRPLRVAAPRRAHATRARDRRRADPAAHASPGSASSSSPRRSSATPSPRTAADPQTVLGAIDRRWRSCRPECRILDSLRRRPSWPDRPAGVRFDTAYQPSDRSVSRVQERGAS